MIYRTVDEIIECASRNSLPRMAALVEGRKPVKYKYKQNLKSRRGKK
jgi:hypothetical protein